MENTKKVSKLYLTSVLLFMLILPVIFTVKEVYSANEIDLVTVAGKWFIFFGVGLRLLTAGIRQVTKPAFTAQEIFHLDDAGAAVIVKELGLANICFALTAILSLFLPAWRPAAAFAGGLYFGLAGVQHIIKKPVSANEVVAMVSDLFITCILAVYLVYKP